MSREALLEAVLRQALDATSHTFSCDSVEMKGAWLRSLAHPTREQPNFDKHCDCWRKKAAEALGGN